MMVLAYVVAKVDNDLNEFTARLIVLRHERIVSRFEPLELVQLRILRLQDPLSSASTLGDRSTGRNTWLQSIGTYR